MTPWAPDWTRDGSRWPNREASRFVEAGSYRWHVQRMGSGPGLVLIHGTGASVHSWAGLMPLLAAHFDVIAMDLPGQGFTRSLRLALVSLPAMVDGILALLTAEKMAPAYLCGHSAGAAIAVRLATRLARPPQLTIALNGAFRPLEGPAGFVGPAIAQACSAAPFSNVIASFAADRRRVIRLIEGTGSKPCEPYLDCYQTLFSRPGHVSGTFRMMGGWNVYGLMVPFEAAGCRLFHIIGSADRAVPPDIGRQLARRCHYIDLLELEGLGHLAHEEDPAGIAAAILEATRKLDTPVARAGAG